MIDLSRMSEGPSTPPELTPGPLEPTGCVRSTSIEALPLREYFDYTPIIPFLVIAREWRTYIQRKYQVEEVQQLVEQANRIFSM
jgi:hypothetical protein